ncbi:hypothetical protein GCM10020220_005270 [Nonomuraea rubra]
METSPYLLGQHRHPIRSPPGAHHLQARYQRCAAGRMRVPPMAHQGGLALRVVPPLDVLDVAVKGPRWKKRTTVALFERAEHPVLCTPATERWAVLVRRR